MPCSVELKCFTICRRRTDKASWLSTAQQCSAAAARWARAASRASCIVWLAAVALVRKLRGRSSARRSSAPPALQRTCSRGARRAPCAPPSPRATRRPSGWRTWRLDEGARSVRSRAAQGSARPPLLSWQTRMRRCGAACSRAARRTSGPESGRRSSFTARGGRLGAASVFASSRHRLFVSPRRCAFASRSQAAAR